MNNKELKHQLRILEEMIDSNSCDDETWNGVLITFRSFISNKTLSMEQVANFFGVAPRTIRRWIKQHDFPSGAQLGHHELSFPFDKIIDWKLSHKKVLEAN